MVWPPRPRGGATEAARRIRRKVLRDEFAPGRRRSAGEGVLRTAADFLARKRVAQAGALGGAI